MANRVDKPVFLDETEVADLLRVSPSTLRRWRGKGEGPAFVKLPTGGVRYRPGDVTAWAESGMQRAG